MTAVRDSRRYTSMLLLVALGAYPPVGPVADTGQDLVSVLPPL